MANMLCGIVKDWKNENQW